MPPRLNPETKVFAINDPSISARQADAKLKNYPRISIDGVERSTHYDTPDGLVPIEVRDSYSHFMPSKMAPTKAQTKTLRSDSVDNWRK
jgi:hypothetical protein